MLEVGDVQSRVPLHSRPTQFSVPFAENVNEVVAAMSSMLGELLGESIELRLSLGPTLGPVLVDRLALEQSLMILALNGRDAMRSGGILAVATAVEDLESPDDMTGEGRSAGRYVAITVTDDGVGLDEYARSRLFEPFFTTKEQGSGLGMGLAMVHGMVRVAGGFVDARPASGGGTALRICYPAARLDPGRGSMVVNA